LILLLVLRQIHVGKDAVQIPEFDMITVQLRLWNCILFFSLFLIIIGQMHTKLLSWYSMFTAIIQLY